MFLLLVDDYSRFLWTVLLCSKDEVPDTIKQVWAEAEAISGKNLGCLYTDRCGEFNSDNFTIYCTEMGVRWLHTAPYSPE
jgi:hypothetical protein